MKTWPPNGHLSAWILDQFPQGCRGYAIDIGASDGKSINTTWALEKAHGWTVLSVEANPAYYPFLIKERAFVEQCACDLTTGTAKFHINVDCPEAYSALRTTPPPDKRGNWLTIEVKVKTAEELLAKWEFPRLDAFCIDTEGTEGEVLRSCDLAKWKPKVIVVEAWEQGKHDEYLSKYGYVRKGRSVDNDLYTREEE